MKSYKVKSLIINRRIFRKHSAKSREVAGFSLIELIASLSISLIILGVAVATFSSALRTRERENSRTDALTSAQAAINIMTREIANAGYGIKTDDYFIRNNGIIIADSTNDVLHIRANVSNNDLTTDDPGEDVVFFYDNASQSVLRYDSNTGITSGVINRVSRVKFTYFHYIGSTIDNTAYDIPTENTGRVRIELWVILPDINGQPTDQRVKFTSDVTLRNSPYMLGQY